MLAVLIGLAAFGLCSVRLAPIPGVEWYLGPLVYLMVLRRWGLRAGLAAAIISMAPSILWWGHPVSILIAMGHVTFIHFRGRSRLLVPSTLLYACTAYLTIGTPLLHFYYGAAAPVILLVLVRKIINDVACAAVVDLLVLQWRFLEAGRLILERRPISLAAFVRTWAHAGLLVMIVTAFMGSLGDFQQDFEYARLRQLEAVRVQMRAQPGPQVGDLSFLDIKGEAGTERVAIAQQRSQLDSDVADYLGCRSVESGRDTKAFNELTDRCSIHLLGIQSGRTAFAMIADKGPAVWAYRAAVQDALPELALSIVMATILALAQRALQKDSGNWRSLLQNFGERRIDAHPDSRFAEFADPLQEFVLANNAYVAAQAGAHERREAFRSLKRSLDLIVLRQIRYDAGDGVLTFLELNPDGASELRELRVHPADRVNVARAMRSELTVEFRVAGEGGQWRMIYGRGHEPGGGYERGLTFKLHQPRMAIDYLRQTARLHEIGITTAATAHELQQPLMIAALAAEQGIAQADAPERAWPMNDRSLFERILGQARRAQRIVDRISRRARLGDEECAVDPSQAVEDVIADVAPQLTRARTTVNVVNQCPPDLRLVVSPTALEQVLINAVRNAADSIDACGREEPGQIDITLCVGDGGDFQIMIEDNGGGLPPGGGEAAFEAFYTTKAPGAGTGLGLHVSREIVEDWGGQLWLSPRQPAGALFALSLPASRMQTGAQRPAGSPR